MGTGAELAPYLIAMTVTSIAASAASTGISMYSQQEQAKTASAIADYNYDIERQNAEVQAKMAQQQALWRQQAAQVQYQLDQNNAQYMDQQARAVQMQAEEKARRVREEGERTLAKQRAQYAASGVVNEGTPLAVLSESAGLIELNAQDAIYEGDVQSRDWLRKAEEARYQSKFSLFDQQAAGYEAAAAKAGKVISLQTAELNRAAGKAQAEGYRISSYGTLLGGVSDIASTASYGLDQYSSMRKDSALKSTAAKTATN